MKTVNKFLVLLLAIPIMGSSTAWVFGQTPDAANKTRQRLVTRNAETLKTDVQGLDKDKLKQVPSKNDPAVKTDPPVKNDDGLVKEDLSLKKGQATTAASTAKNPRYGVRPRST